jgi:hypothetical protein
MLLMMMLEFSIEHNQRRRVAFAKGPLFSFVARVLQFLLLSLHAPPLAPAQKLLAQATQAKVTRQETVFHQQPRHSNSHHRPLKNPNTPSTSVA